MLLEKGFGSHGLARGPVPSPSSGEKKPTLRPGLSAPSCQLGHTATASESWVYKWKLLSDCSAARAAAQAPCQGAGASAARTASMRGGHAGIVFQAMLDSEGPETRKQPLLELRIPNTESVSESPGPTCVNAGRSCRNRLSSSAGQCLSARNLVQVELETPAARARHGHAEGRSRARAAGRSP